MSYLRNILIISVVLLFSTMAWAGSLYKCKGKGIFDTPVWQDSPCQYKSDEIKMIKPEDYSKKDQSKVGHGNFTAKQVAKMIRKHLVAVGMSKKDVFKSWGRPYQIFRTTTDLGKKFELHYGNSQYVHINEEGLVSMIQNKDNENIKKKKTPPKRGLGRVNSKVVPYKKL